MRQRTEEVAARLEKSFEGLGEDARRLGGLADEMVSNSEELLGLATGRVTGKEVLQEAMTQLRRPVEFLETAEHRSSEVLDLLRRHQKGLADLRRLEISLQRAVAPLRYIQTFFRVESASLPAEVQHVFSSLTQDIEQLHHRVAELFDQQFKSLQDARRTIDGLVQRLAAQLQDHQRVARERTQALEAVLAEMQQALTENRGTDGRLTGTTRSLHQQIGRLTSFLDLGVSVGQRLRRVAEAIVRIQSNLGGHGAPSERIPPGGRELEFATVGAIARGLASAVAKVTEDLTRGEGDCRNGMRALIRGVEALDDDCLTLRNTRGISVAEDGMVQVVLNTLADIRVLTDSLLAVHTETHEAIRPLGSLASNLTGTMRRLSGNIRMIALNAQIQAANIGAGTGLEVLSQRTCNIADEAAALNEEAAIELDRLTSDFERMVSGSAELRELTGAEQAWLGGQGSQIEQQLHAYRDTTLRILHDVGDLKVRLREGAQEALSRPGFASEAANALQPVHDLLRAVAQASPPEHRNGARAEGSATFPGGHEDIEVRTVGETVQGTTPATRPPDPARPPAHRPADKWEFTATFADRGLPG